MLATPQLSIATHWPSNPSLSAFLFYYTLSQSSILSTDLCASVAYIQLQGHPGLLQWSYILKWAHLPCCEISAGPFVWTKIPRVWSFSVKQDKNYLFITIFIAGNRLKLLPYTWTTISAELAVCEHFEKQTFCFKREKPFLKSFRSRRLEKNVVSVTFF